METSVPGTFAEWGELPADSEDKAPEMFQLMQEPNRSDGNAHAEIRYAGRSAFLIHILFSPPVFRRRFSF